jgi:hypothetical protein
MKLGAPGSSVFCSASKGGTSEPTSWLSLPDRTGRAGGSPGGCSCARNHSPIAETRAGKRACRIERLPTYASTEPS